MSGRKLYVRTLRANDTRHVGLCKGAPRIRVSSTACRSKAERLIAFALRPWRSAVAALGEVTRARLHLVEQPHVLDRDDGLISERLQQLDLTLVERTRVLSGHVENADRLALAQKRYAPSIVR